MAEFGHDAFVAGGICVDSWGAGPFIIHVGGKSFRFEDSDRFGPALINKNDELKANPYPGEQSPFWRAHRCWIRQGRKLADDGITCMWREPKPTLIRRIGRTAIVIENGEEDGGYTEVKYTDPFPPPPGASDA